MNTKKKTILAAAFVVAIIALAGVGFAANYYSAYKGTTESATGTYDVDWVTVELNTGSGYTGYTGPTDIYIAYDTINNAGTISYKYLGSTAVKYGVVVTIPSDKDSTDDREKFTLTVTPGSISGTDAAHYELQYSVDGETFTAYSAALTYDVTPAAGNTTVTKDIYFRIAPKNVDSTTSITTEFDGTTRPAGTMAIPAIAFEVVASTS